MCCSTKQMTKIKDIYVKADKTRTQSTLSQERMRCVVVSVGKKNKSSEPQIRLVTSLKFDL